MSEQQSISPRRRLQELLAIPERQRTDAQWDELNELEIALASANRAETREQGAREPGTREQGARRNGPASGDQPKPSGDAQGRKPFKRLHKRPPKENAP